MQTEIFDNAADFMAALVGKPRTKRGRATRPDILSAGRSPSTGLTSLIAGKVRVWSIEYRVGAGFRMYVINEPAFDTGFCPTEAAACQAAKGMS